MKNLLLKFAGASLLALGLSTAALATPINGSINFGSNNLITVDTGNLATATAITGYGAAGSITVSNGTQTGDYVGTDGTVVTFSPFTFSPASTPFQLWSFVSGGLTYSFTVNSVVVGPNPRVSQYLNLGGWGIASITGFDDTVGSWTITDTASGTQAKITFGSTATVPDGGTTALLLGLGLVGMSFIARRRKQIQA